METDLSSGDNCMKGSHCQTVQEVSLLSQLFDFKFQDVSFKADLTEFLSLKNRH